MRLTVQQVAAHLDVSNKRVYQFVSSGRLIAQREPLSGRLYILDSELQRFLHLPRIGGRPKKSLA